MGLTYNTARSLLRQIVGGSGAWSTQNIWLGLSTTKPTQCPATPSSQTYADYNITEPSESSYARVALTNSYQSQYFGTDPVATQDLETGKWTFTISNDREIHFNECTDADGWNEGHDIKYFAIFTTGTKGSGAPIYVGEIETAIQVTVNTVPLIRVGNLSISVE